MTATTRSGFLCIAVLWLAALSGGMQTQKASADVVDLNCTGTDQATYNPGLTNTPQTTTATLHETLAPCLITKDPTVLGGTTVHSVSLVASCTQAAFPGDSTTFLWSNGRTSTVNFATTSLVRLADGTAQLTQAGTVTDGEFVGDKAVRVVTAPQLDVTACLAPPGVTSVTGAAVLTLTSLP